ncbi:MAG: hypothetical protein C3F13_08615 [Anaerolineales bacterium]|nr:MAG: hypothetical protein C3F13_08615 [Anaerolineales bacterium]
MPRENKHSHWEWRTSHAGHSFFGFKCRVCQAYVPTLEEISGVQNRNHCPNCLCSRHMDWMEAGDRLSACKAVMYPVGLSIKWSHNKYARVLDGELLLVHQCTDCGKLSINRIAADDRPDMLQELFHTSIEWVDQLQMSIKSDIHLLTKKDAWLIDRQLGGLGG